MCVTFILQAQCTDPYSREVYPSMGRKKRAVNDTAASLNHTEENSQARVNESQRFPENTKYETVVFDILRVFNNREDIPGAKASK